MALSLQHVKDIREIYLFIKDISSYHQNSSQKEIKQAIVNLQSSIDKFELNHEPDTLLTIPRLQLYYANSKISYFPSKDTDTM